MGGSRGGGRPIVAFRRAGRHVRRRLTKTRNNTCRLSRDNEPVSAHTGSIPFHSRHSPSGANQFKDSVRRSPPIAFRSPSSPVTRAA